MKRMKQAGQLRLQHGVTLVLTLIVLVALTLASLALVRSTDTSSLIAGNLAFKQSAMISSDSGVEAAIAWLAENAAGLQADIAGSGYYATSQAGVDLTGSESESPDDNLDWHDENGVFTLEKDKAGNQISFVIHRMCDTPGPLNGNTCATEESTAEDNSQGSNRQMLTYQPGAWDQVANRGFYRITVRVNGPRSNVAYTQAIIAQ